MAVRRLLIVAHAPSPNTLRLRDAAVRGARHPDIEGVETKAVSPFDAAPPDVLAADALLPVDGVLMELGRAYRLAGRSDEARAAFQRIMDEFPTSLYFTNAERELQVLQIAG